MSFLKGEISLFFFNIFIGGANFDKTNLKKKTHRVSKNKVSKILTKIERCQAKFSRGHDLGVLVPAKC